MKRSVSRVAKEIQAALGRVTVTGEVFLHKSTLQQWLMLLCPPMAGSRKVRGASAVRSARRTTRKHLDMMCRDLVFLRDANRCRRCGNTRSKLDWSHVYAKGAHPWLRWDLDNSKVLCASCHMNWWHARPEEAMKWWEKEIGSVAMQALRLRAARPRKITLEMVRLYLEQEARKLGAVGAGTVSRSE